MGLVAQAKSGEARLKDLCAKGKLQAGEFLTADPEIDPPDLPTAHDFLSAQGLAVIPI